MKEAPTEQTDLAASEPAMLKQLKARYAQLRATQLDQTYVHERVRAYATPMQASTLYCNVVM